jgi:hypothetical protein
MAFCSNCGTQFQDGARFCPKCGVPAAQPVAPPVYAPPPQQVPYYPPPGYAPQPMPYGMAQPRYGGKSKTAAVLLGFFLGPWTWVYTFKRDGAKFWISFVVGILWSVAFAFTQSYGILILGYILSFGVWASAFFGALIRSGQWYAMY